jgi:activator of HSP90 ATPase
METIKDGQWTIRADGGDGGNGRNGPSLTTDNIRKWSKEKFKKDFPSMSTLNSKHHKSAMSTVIKTLDEIMPVENRDRGATKLLSHQENVYIEGTAQDGSRITVSFFTKKNQVTKKLKKRCTLILCQGENDI